MIFTENEVNRAIINFHAFRGLEPIESTCQRQQRQPVKRRDVLRLWPRQGSTSENYLHGQLKKSKSLWFCDTVM